MVSKSVTVCGNTYKVDYPTVGKFIDIHVLEAQLSKGMSGQMIYGTADQQASYVYILTYAHLAILIPQLMKDLKADSLLDLSMKDFGELVNVFVKEIQPWLNDIRDDVKERTDGKEGKED